MTVSAKTSRNKDGVGNWHVATVRRATVGGRGHQMRLGAMKQGMPDAGCHELVVALQRMAAHAIILGNVSACW
jgi:hypothetical protein